MGDAGRFALGIAVITGAMIFFFFAFHPGGVQGVDNPVEMLKWLINEFQTASGTAAPSASSASSGPQNKGASPAAGGA